MFKVTARYARAVAVFAVLMSSSFVAHAQSGEAAALMPSVTVNYADLNLNTPAGVDALYARLRAASRSVCNVGQRRALAEVMASRSCYREVLGAAIANANVPTLTARYRVESAHEG